jgi:acetoin utilization deacetylase AcuC-like enzyme
MVRRFQLQPLWQAGLAAIDLPNQSGAEQDNATAVLGLEFFSALPNLAPTFVASDVPKLRAQLHYVIPFDAIRSGAPPSAIDAAYRLELTNLGSTTIYISPSSERAGGLQAPIAVGPGQTASVFAGGTISWSQISCSTLLVLSPDLPFPQTQAEEHNARHALHASFPPSMPTYPHSMDVDPSSRTYVQGFSTRQAPSAPVPILQLDPNSPAADERNPLKEAIGTSIPMDVAPRSASEMPGARVKTEATSPRGVGSPRSAFREAMPQLKNRMPQLLHDLAPSISPRNSIGAGGVATVPPISPRHSLSGPPSESVLASSALREIQARHAGEMEALLMNQQLEVVSLVTRQKLELDSFVRGVPMLPHAQASNLGVLGVFNTLNKLQTMLQQRELTGSGEIDILSVDEPSTDNGAWKTTAGGHGAAPVVPRTSKKARARKETHSHSTSPANASPGPSAHNHASSSHNHHSPAQVKVAASESGSEEEGMRRAQRKRKTPVQPDYFVDDREMEQILGGKKRRAEASSNAPDAFAVPVAVPTPSPASTPVPFKKPKPRDNVSIATILDIYSPLKSTLPPWKFVTGDKTLILFHTDCLDHITPEWHLESPNRLRAVMDSIALVQERYAEFCEVVSDFSPADLELVRQCHHETYIKKIMNKIPANRAMPPLHATQDIELTLSMSSSLTKPPAAPGSAEPQCETPKDTFVSFGSWNAALLAAGSVIVAIDRLFKEPLASQSHLRNAFCGVRPPGHHAGSHGHDGASTNGYCVLNSVAIGAQYAFHAYNLKRIAILDFDVHQGNGTAQIVEKDPRILFISLHGSEIYPFSEATKADADKCTDRVINIGYPSGTTGKQFMELFVNRCRQVLVDFNPELILLSAGFDAHIDDPTGAAMLRFADYVALTRVIKEIADTPACKGRIISVLEGGYDIRALKLSVTAHILALMEGPAAYRRQIASEAPKPVFVDTNGSATQSNPIQPLQINSTVPSSTTTSTASSNAMAVDTKSEFASPASSQPETPSAGPNNP